MARRAALTHLLFGPPGSPLRRRLRTLPLAGPVVARGVGAWRGVRRVVVGRRLRLQDAYTDFRNRHARTAGNIAKRNTRRAYERVYADDRLLGEYLAPERLAFYREVADTAAALRPRSVVDVGCGTGHLLHELVARAAPPRVVGIDHAGAGIRRAAELVPSGEFHVASLYDLRLDDRFDLVLCTEVLEHLADPGGAVERLAALCAPSGAVLITVPDGASDTWEGHLNYWTAEELEAFLAPYGDVELRRAQDNLMAILEPRRRQ